MTKIGPDRGKKMHRLRQEEKENESWKSWGRGGEYGQNILYE